MQLELQPKSTLLETRLLANSFDVSGNGMVCCEIKDDLLMIKIFRRSIQNLFDHSDILYNTFMKISLSFYLEEV